MAHPYTYLARLDRVCAASLASAVVAITLTSTVGRGFWHFEPFADLLNIAYLAALAAVAINPSAKHHAAAAILGVLWWLGRGGAFAVLATDGNPNLIGSAVRDSVAGTITAVTVHVYGLYRARRAETLHDAQ